MIGFADLERSRLIEGLAALLDTPASAEDFARQDEGLRSRPRRSEAPFRKQNVGAGLWHATRLDYLSSKGERRYLAAMARNVLFLLGVGSIGWALLCLFAGSIMPDWMGLTSPTRGSLYIESIALNVGLWSALGAFALFGAAFQRLRLAAALAFMVCSAGIAGGRVLALVQGAKPDHWFSGIALVMEVAIVIAASAAYVSEKARLSREAKEQKRAEKAALEAALAARHVGRVGAASPSPAQQP
jgi:hypothetical protein